MSRRRHFGMKAKILVRTEYLEEFRAEVRELVDLVDELWELSEEERAELLPAPPQGEPPNLINKTTNKFKSIGKRYG